MMRCERVNPEKCRRLVCEWIKNLPPFVRAEMDGRLPEFVLLISDAAPLMVFTGEEKAKNVLDVHLFSPRRIEKTVLSKGMNLAKKAFFSEPGVEKLVFTVLARQNVLKDCLAENGCIFTGWAFIEKGNVFEHWVLQK